MLSSLVCQYVLLSIYKKKLLMNTLDMNNFGAILSLGLYELKKNDVIEETYDGKIIKKLIFSLKSDLPEDLSYLNQIYEAINGADKKTINDIILAFYINQSGGRYSQLINDITEYLLKKGYLVEETKKGFLNKTKKVLKANEECVVNTLDNIVAGISQETVMEDIIVFAEVLRKSGLLYSCFTKEQIKAINQKLNNEKNKTLDENVYNTLKAIDIIYAIIVSFLTTSTNS